MIDYSDILSRRQVQFITLFFGGAELCCAFNQPRHDARIWSRKNQFPELNRSSLTFLQEILLCGVILSTVGDALTDEMLLLMNLTVGFLC